MKFHVSDDGRAYYDTIDGDAVDLIAFNYYGYHEGTSQHILEANRGLADYGTTLPAGVRVWLPDLPEKPPQTTINLWD